MKLSLATDFVSGLFATAAVVLLILGVSSTTWPRAMAIVASHRTESVAMQSYGTRHARNTPLNVEVANYQYTVDGATFSGTRVCFCLPLGAPSSNFDRSGMTVAYYPPDPSLAVLFPGTDMLSVIALLLIAGSVFASGRFLPSYFRQQSTRQNS